MELFAMLLAVTVLEKGAARDLVGYGDARGRVVDEVHWKDASGDNLLLLSVREERDKESGFETKTFFAARYGDAGDGGYEILQSAHDAVEDCPEDAVIDAKVLGVTDVDRDGLAEVAFSVQRACVSDMSPLRWNVHVWEDGSDTVIFGRQPYCEEDAVGACAKPSLGEIYGAHWAGASKAVRELARRTWAENVPLVEGYPIDAATRKKIRAKVDAKAP